MEPLPARLASGSPIDSLSDDVLLLIFHCCTENTSYRVTEGENDSLRTDHHPWVLSYVSRRWRGLVLSSPLLWSTIKVDMEEYVPSRRRASYLPFLLNLILQRSRNIELNVEVRDTYRCGDNERQRYNIIKNYLAPLLSTTSRWRHLKISTYPEVFKMLSGDSFACLRSLRLCLLGNTDHENYLNIFRNAPKLAQLRLDSSMSGGRWYNIHFPGVIRSIALPWSGIRCFTTPIDTLVSLPQMPYLEELYITPGASLTVMHSGPLGLPRITLPFLHTISSTQYVGPQLCEASRCIIAPGLRTLTLHIQCPSPTIRLEPYLPDFEDIDKVIDLSIMFKVDGGGSSVDDEIVAFLSRARSVETLSLGSNCGVPATMKAIGCGQILPKLTTLSLHISSICVDEGDVVDMLERRVRSPVNPISEFRVVHFDWHRRRMAFGRPMSMAAIVKDVGLLRRWVRLCRFTVVRFVCED